MKIQLRYLSIAMAITVVVAIGYLQIFNAPFSLWDDADYITRNEDIAGFSADNIVKWFTRFYLGNYHPLTLASYAIDYSIGELSSTTFHSTNILIHLINVILVWLLSIRITGSKTVGFLSALIFGTHPIQTEVVSWVAERKTLLCSTFSLSAFILYADYVKKKSTKKYLGIMLLGLAAMLSKGTAAAIPAAFLSIDLMLGRDLQQRRAWIEKIPITILAIITGIIALAGQEHGGYLHQNPVSLSQSVVLAGYAFTSYLANLLYPAHLSVIYPYPAELRFMHFFYFFIAVCVIVSIVVIRKRMYLLAGGLLFFTLNILPVLQFIQFGKSLMADRYQYLACVGIVIPAAFYLTQLMHSRPWTRYAIAVIPATLIVLTFARNKIWASPVAFVASVVDEYPLSATARCAAGSLYLGRGDLALARKNLTEAYRLSPNDESILYNMGVLYMREGKSDSAIEAFSDCIRVSGGRNNDAYFARGLLRMKRHQYTVALQDAEVVLTTEKRNSRAWYVHGYCSEQLSRPEIATSSYTKAIRLEPNEPQYYVRRARLLLRANKITDAAADILEASRLDTTDGEISYLCGVVACCQNREPCNDFRIALRKGYKVPEAVLAQYCSTELQ